MGGRVIARCADGHGLSIISCVCVCVCIPHAADDNARPKVYAFRAGFSARFRCFFFYFSKIDRPQIIIIVIIITIKTPNLTTRSPSRRCVCRIRAVVSVRARVSMQIGVALSIRATYWRLATCVCVYWICPNLVRQSETQFRIVFLFDLRGFYNNNNGGKKKKQKKKTSPPSGDNNARVPFARRTNNAY